MVCGWNYKPVRIGQDVLWAWTKRDLIQAAPHLLPPQGSAGNSQGSPRSGAGVRASSKFQWRHRVVTQVKHRSQAGPA